MENELEQMRIRMAEMAAEVERLNAVIDEANAQKPIYQYSNTHDLSLWTDCNKWTFDIMRDDHRRIVYASPIPAQQSRNQALQLLAESRENFEKQFGVSADADWVYQDLAELLVSDLPEHQSPAVVAGTDSYDTVSSIAYTLHNYATHLHYAGNEYLSDQLEEIVLRLWKCKQTPCITDPDATEIESTECVDNIPTLGDADRVVGATDFTDYIDGLKK